MKKQNYSTVKDDEEITGHEVRSTDVEILERGVNNHQKRLFLEAIHSVRTKDSVNEHIELPQSCIFTVNYIIRDTNRRKLNH